MYKVDYRKSSKIMFKLSMPQKAPKRRSPNIGERRAKLKNYGGKKLPSQNLA